MNTAKSRLVGLFIRSFLYGIYTTIFAHTLRWIFYEDDGWKLRRRLNGLMLTISTLVFVSVTVNFGIYHKLVLSSVTGQKLLNERLVAVIYGLGRVTTLIIDTTLVYRCWIVYSRSWRVIYFPLVLLLSNVGLLIGSYLYKAPGIPVGYHDLRLSVAFYTCNIVINIYTIFAIIYQIRQVSAAVEGTNRSGSNLYEIGRILVECGLPYLFTSTFALVSAITANRSLMPIGSALSSTMNGIAFNLILIRVGLHRAGTSTGKWDDKWASSLSFDVQKILPSTMVKSENLRRSN